MMRRIEDLKGIDADALFEELIEATRKAADGDELMAEKLLTEIVVTEFVNYNIEKAEEKRLIKAENEPLKIPKAIKSANSDDYCEIAKKKRKMVQEKATTSILHVNSLDKKRLQELLQRDNHKKRRGRGIDERKREHGCNANRFEIANTNKKDQEW